VLALADVVDTPCTLDPPEPADARLARWAAERHGVVSRREAMDLGATPRMIHWRLATGRWQELHPGVYRLAGAPRTWRQHVLAACISCGLKAFASHRAAGALRHLDGVEQGRIEVTVLRGARTRRTGVLIHETPSIPEIDVEVVDSIPATAPTRTLIDLAALIPKDAVEAALDDALRRGLTSLPRLSWRLGDLARRGRPGVAVIRALIDARTDAPVPGSALEKRFEALVRRARLPVPVPQHAIRVRGKLIALVDFAYPEIRLAIEVDGYRWHSGRARWEHDLARRNRLTSIGWRVIHVTLRQLQTRPDDVAQTIAAAMAEQEVPAPFLQTDTTLDVFKIRRNR